MIRPFTAIAAMTLLTACATTPPEQQVKIVYVDRPVAVSCVPANVDIDPDFQVEREDVLAAPDAAERLRFAGAGFLERDAYIGVIQPVLKGCSDAPRSSD